MGDHEEDVGPLSPAELKADVGEKKADREVLGEHVRIPRRPAGPEFARKEGFDSEEQIEQ